MVDHDDNADPRNASTLGSGNEPDRVGGSESGDVLERIVARAQAGLELRESRIVELKSREEQLRVELAAVQAERSETESEARLLRGVAEMFDGVVGASAEGRHGDAFIAFQSASRLRNKVLERDPELGPGLASKEKDLRSLAERVALDLGRTLPPALDERGVPLDRSSSFPKFSVRKGYIQVTVKADKGKAIVESRGGKKVSVSVDPASLADAVAALFAEVFNRSTDRSTFLSALSSAYDVARERTATDAVPISEVIDELKGSSRDFTLDEFLVDLEAVAYGSQSGGSDGIVVRLDTTKDTKLGVLLPGREEQGYKGYLKLETRRGNSGDEGTQRA